jgi:hypothetical protein
MPAILNISGHFFIGAIMNMQWIKIIVVGAALAIGYGSYLISKTPDNPVEQAAEAVLRSQGVDIDLSPNNDEE